ncbi:hypothetical protein niasHS_001428 [Heterodera schachtii]|uniref:Globin domain-containing protein n=1 Tax=Heterodera schachtii TaxID=97005 RepID=A0ABD2KDE7_HETSC
MEQQQQQQNQSANDHDHYVTVSGQFCCGVGHCSALMRSFRALFHGTGGDVAAQNSETATQKIAAVAKNGGTKMANGQTNDEKSPPTTTQQQQKPNEISKISAPSVDDSLDGLNEEQVLGWEPNDYEKELVKRTWSDDFDFLYELGASIYDYIFEHNPQAKQLFPKIHRHGDEWRQSADFRSQALKFVQTIAYAAKNLYHMEECLKPSLLAIGERHVQYAARGFRPEHWNIFLDAMEQALTEHIRSLADFSAQQRADATRTWRRLAHYIITHMKMGYGTREAAESAAANHQ